MLNDMTHFRPARDMDDAWIAVDEFPLKPGDPRYMDCSRVRGNTRKLITRYLKLHYKAGRDLHLLFTGYRGNGKTTELYQLQHDIKDEYEVVYFDASKELDVNNVTLSDLMLAIAKATFEQMNAAGYTLSKQLLEDVGTWFFEKVLEKSRKNSLVVGAQVEAGTPKWFSAIVAKAFSVVKMNTEEREVMRRTLERNVTELIEKVNALLTEARTLAKNNGKKDLLFLMDSLDRLRQGLEKNIFMADGALLKQLQCNFIYVVPISLMYNEQATLLPFDEQLSLPMIPIFERGTERKEHHLGIGILKDLISKRLDLPQIFTDPDGIVKDLILCSGGHLRDLMKLISYACSLTDHSITPDIANAAMNKLMLDYEKVVRDEEYAHVVAVYNTQAPPNNEVNQKLIYNNVILVYRSDDETEWKDVHPAVVRNNKFQKAL